MQPQYPYAPPPTPQPTPVNPGSAMAPAQPPTPHPADYSFIMSPATRPTKKLFGGGHLNKLAILIAALVVLGAGFGLYALLTRNATSNVTLLTNIAQQQTEIIRVAGVATAQPNISQTTKNLALTTQLTATSDRTSVTKYLGQAGHKLNAKQLALGKNSSTDTSLTAAISSGNFDSAYVTILKQQLVSYETTLKDTYKVTSGPNGRALLNLAYENAQLLLQAIAAL